MEIDLFQTSKLKKIYKGAYDYFEGTRKYCEETFEVFKDDQNQSLIFKAEVSGRAANGEFLLVNVHYKLTQRFNPVAVMVKKTMGKQITSEYFLFDSNADKMRYRFNSKNVLGEIQMNTKQKIHIATPSICTSLLFLKSKKFQNTAINNYTTLMSDNQWDLNQNLRFEEISIERISGTPIDIEIKDQNVSAMKYRLINYVKEAPDSKNKYESLDIYLSKHLSIPYKIEDLKNKKNLEIRYFNHLEKSVE